MQPSIPSSSLEKRSVIKPSAPRVLVVENEQVTRRVLCKMLESKGVMAIPCNCLQDCMTALAQAPFPEAALVALKLSDGDGFEILRYIKSQRPSINCIVVTGSVDAGDARSAFKAGASDFLTKPVDAKKLYAALMATPPPPISKPIPPSTEQAWKSSLMRELVNESLIAARSNCPVMILGEKQTGKTRMAQSIHSANGESNGGLLVVDVAAQPQEELEVRLFGRKLQTAFGKISSTPGLLPRLRGTNLLLKNIELLSPVLQVRMVEWLESEVEIDDRNQARCRLITTTTSNLPKLIEDGKFRSDLFYRLTTYQLRMPQLAERSEDITTLCGLALTRLSIARKKSRPTISRAAEEALTDYRWPGNFTELMEVLEIAFLNCRGGIVHVDDLPIRFRQDTNLEEANEVPDPDSTLNEITKANLVSALEACGGNRRRAAQRLKISLRTVYNMIHRYEIALKRPQRSTRGQNQAIHGKEETSS
jgi:DNA-binding NtrC family response regulator